MRKVLDEELLDVTAPATKQVARALRLFNRVPDDIILAALGGPGLTMTNGNRCLCGWFVRASVAKIRDIAVDLGPTPDDPARDCMVLFGGSITDWAALYTGVTKTTRPISSETDNHQPGCQPHWPFECCCARLRRHWLTDTMILQDIEIAMLRRLDPFSHKKEPCTTKISNTPTDLPSLCPTCRL